MYYLLGLCIFPNMVINDNMARKLGEKQKHNVLLLTILTYYEYSLCTFFDIVIDTNIARKIRKWTVVDNIGYVHGLCTFANIVINTNVIRKIRKIM